MRTTTAHKPAPIPTALAKVLPLAVGLWVAISQPAWGANSDSSAPGWIAVTFSLAYSDAVNFNIQSNKDNKRFGSYSEGGFIHSRFDFQTTGTTSKYNIEGVDKCTLGYTGSVFGQKIVLQALPAGNYRIHALKVSRQDGNLSRFQNFDDIAFTVSSGKVSYLGQLEFLPIGKPTMFGNICVVTGWYPNVSDQSARDNPVIAARTGAQAEPASRADVTTTPH